MQICADLASRILAAGSGRSDSGPAIVLSGPPGIGKTAVISDVVRRLEAALNKEFESSPAGAAARKKVDDGRKQRQAAMRNSAKATRHQGAGRNKAAGAGTAAAAVEASRSEFREPRTVVPGRALIAHLVGSTDKSNDRRVLLIRLILELREVHQQTMALKSTHKANANKDGPSLLDLVVEESAEACVRAAILSGRPGEAHSFRVQ